MNKEEMKQQIMSFMKLYKTGVSFAELQRSCGDAAYGDYHVSPPKYPNVILWAGMSSEFVDAFDEVVAELTLLPTSFLIYAYDGQTLNLPLFPEDAGVDPDATFEFPEPVWLPIAISLREVAESVTGRNDAAN